MKVTAWNRGDHRPDGNGYGLKIDRLDRDRYFIRAWGAILLELEGESEPVAVNIDKDSFWGTTCRELISVRIGRWLIRNRLAPWKKGNPPQLFLEPTGDNQFRLRISK